MKHLYHQYGPLVIFIVMLFFGYLILKPFIMPILSAGLLAYIFYPLYLFLNKKIKKKSISSILTILLMFLIFIIPSFFIINNFLGEVPSVYNNLVKATQNSTLISEFTTNVYNDFGIELNIKNMISTAFNSIIGFLQGFITSVPNKILKATIAAFFMYYFLKHGKKIIKKITFYLPFGRSNNIMLLDEIKSITNAVVYGQLITAGIQGIIAVFGYWLLGVNSPLFWAVITAGFSIIPMVGPGVAYIPLGGGTLISGIVNHDNSGIFKGLALLVFGFGIISSVDNVVKPIVIGDKLKIHPLVILIGIIGGLLLFGVIGLVLGPLIFVMIRTIFKIYSMKQEMLENKELLDKIE